MPIITISTDRGHEVTCVRGSSKIPDLGAKLVTLVEAAEEAQLTEKDLLENGRAMTCVNCGHTDTLKPLDPGEGYPLMFGSDWDFCTGCDDPWDGYDEGEDDGDSEGAGGQ